MDDSEMSATDHSVSPESVILAVGGGGSSSVQICPAITLGSPHAIPIAAKYIYSRLADNAAEIDEGMPNIILSLVSNGNQLSDNYLSRIQSALGELVYGGGLWFVSSGEYHDPLARAISCTFRTVLPQIDRNVEVLHLMVNTIAVTAREESRLMADATSNTILILSRNIHAEQEAIFRANTVIRLVHPPPALLIGVPPENVTCGAATSAMAAPILLSPSNEKRPLPAVIFAGASVVSLEELLVYIQNGFPVIILQDSCELCVILHSAYLLYRSPQFEHSKFVVWLEEQLSAISINDVNASTKLIVKIFATAFGDAQLIEFIDSDELSSLPSRIVELCLQCHNSTTESRNLLQFAVRINEPSILNEINLDELLDDDLLTVILCETVAVPNRVGFLGSILERKSQLPITSEMLLKMARAASDQHFFTTVVLCQCMGYSSFPQELDEKFLRDLNRLLKRLSFGINDLIPSSTLNGNFMHHPSFPQDSIQILAVSNEP
ncbi:hypothetical protein DICVIV_03074 [Dictyocaulus viviparus]|uniref:Uncharacterized protein n=1 Tax=Dictyocaulus viviparus TaxID=29172 RepID=A0A0D8Y1L9_DICVI|nr:hypothetical protein DICVIV_03074 [Dictyocaulus viviparus]